MRRCCGTSSSPAKIALERSARLLADAGMHAEAAETLRKRARLSPQNPLIWNDLGVRYMAAGLLDAAHEAFTRSQRVRQDYSLALYNLGAFAIARCIQEQAKEISSPQLIRGFAVEAIYYLKESLLRDPLLSQAHVLLSTACKALGDERGEQFHTEEALKIDPSTFVIPKQSWIEKLLRRTLKHTHQIRLPLLLSSGDTVKISA